jgi:hypothetical protein
MEQILSWEAESCSYNQEVPSSLRNPMVCFSNQSSLKFYHNINLSTFSHPIPSRSVLILSFNLRQVVEGSPFSSYIAWNTDYKN